MRTEATRRRSLVVTVSLWLLSIAAGTSALTVYSMRPGKPAEAPPSWPSDVRFLRANDKLTLVMNVHPHCSCSRASIAELARLMTDSVGRIDAHVLLLQLSDNDAATETTELYDAATRIPGLQVHVDREGKWAAAFGAETSGQVLLYSPDGRLLFSGGITPARSHHGASEGRRKVLELTRRGSRETRERSSPATASVYGCPLKDEQESAASSKNVTFRSEGELENE